MVEPKGSSKGERHPKRVAGLLPGAEVVGSIGRKPRVTRVWWLVSWMLPFSGWQWKPQWEPQWEPLVFRVPVRESDCRTTHL